MIGGKLVSLNANLVDIANSLVLRKLLKSEVIIETQRLKKEYKKEKAENKSPCRPNFPDFQRAIFGKGKVPKDRVVELVSAGNTDLIETFNSILLESSNNLKQVHHIYLMELENLLGKDFASNRVFYVELSGLFESSSDLEIKNKIYDQKRISTNELFEAK